MATSTLYCDACGAENIQQARFCFSCGKPLYDSHLSSPAANVSQLLLTGNLPVNHVLKQRYRICSLLGEGGMGAVYKAEDTQFGNRLMAVKEMRQAVLSPQEAKFAIDAFKREALLLAGLMHPHIPRIYDHFSEAGRWYLIMDFIEGSTLEEYQSNSSQGFLPVEEVITIGLQLCTALDYLHSRQPPIIFRDLKPANIMRTPNGQLYLIDFGIARHFKPGQLRDTIPFGSVGYAAPEQYGRVQTSPRADIYSLGATLHQLLSGRNPTLNPFRFAPLLRQDQPVPAELETLIMQMVDLDEHNRPASVVLVRQELQRLTTRQTTAQMETVRLETQAGPPPLPTTRRLAPMGTTLLTYRDHSARVLGLAWSPDGKRIASGSWDNTVHLWDAWEGSFVYVHSGHTSWLNAVAWSPNSTRIASASNDGTVHLWDANTGREVFTNRTYQGHVDDVKAVAWSPDGTRIASGGNDTAVQVWDAG